MKHSKRLLSGVLSLAIAGSLCTSWIPAVYAAEPEAADTGQTTEITLQKTGSIHAKLRMDFSITKEQFAKSDAKIELYQNDKIIATSKLTEDGNLTFTESAAPDTVKPAGDVALTVEGDTVKYVDVTITGLSAESGSNTYTLKLTGKQFKSYTSPVLTLDTYSKGIILGTGDATFTYGDLNGDEKVDAADVDVIETALSASVQDTDKDLNGDGKLDVTDLAIIVKAAAAAGDADATDDADVRDTEVIPARAVDFSAMEATLQELKSTQKVEGDLSSLFTETVGTVSDNSVKIIPLAGADEIQLPIPLATASNSQGIEMEQVEITSPAANPLEKGTLIVESGDDKTFYFKFDESTPEGVYLLESREGHRTVTINLGKKVPVKKITIKVDVTGDEPVVVEQIKFLQDIVPEDLAPANTTVEGLTAQSGSEEITLTWKEFPNITGYRVYYGTSRDAMTQQIDSETNRCTVTGLENLTTYYFAVAPVSGDWEGDKSEVVSAAPQPDSEPGAPDNVSIAEADTSLRVSWNKTENATYYQVFYRVKDSGDWIQFGENITATSAIITGLTNGTEYEVKVRAGNSVGLSEDSVIATGTPAGEEMIEAGFPAEGRIDADQIESIVMADPTNYNAEMCPNFDVKDLVDNNTGTYWIANNWWYNSSITYTFKEPVDMNYVLVAPYLDDRYKNRIDNYSVTARDEAGNVLTQLNGRTAPALGGDNYIIFSFPETKGIKSLTVGMGEKAGGPRVSISEIAFYKSDLLAEEIAGLFADDAYTTLKSDVTAETVDQLSERLNRLSSFYMDVDLLSKELKLAGALLGGKTDVESIGLVKQDFQTRSAAADSSYGQTAGALQPLGVIANAGATVAVYADLPGDEPVYIVPSQFYGETGAWKGTPVRLENGRNYINVEKIGSLSDTRGGMLYVTYAGGEPEKITIHVLAEYGKETSGAKVTIAPILEMSDWYKLSETQRKERISSYIDELKTYINGSESDSWKKTGIRNATEISTPSVLLSVPATQVLAGLGGKTESTAVMTQNLYHSLQAWEELLFLANKTQGIIDADASIGSYEYPMQTRQNIRYSRMFGNAFMFAAGEYVGIEYNETSGMVSGKPLDQQSGDGENGLFGWGIAHEIGHNMDKIGYAEITNNIYSLVAQTADSSGQMTGKSRLELNNIYESVFDKTALGKPGQAGNVFVQLGMYWQLHLAYDGGGDVMNGGDSLDFFNKFFTAYKSGSYNGSGISGVSKDEKIALIASQVANRDLTEFFTRWGMELSDAVKAELAKYDKETRDIWYLNDESRRLRLSGATAADDVSVALSAEVQENTDGQDGSSVTLTIQTTGANDNIQGYEILRNGTPVKFLTSNGESSQTYVDEIGSANNVAVSYSVRAIDKLGNEAAEAKAGDVRVSYDKTIDQSLYDIERDGDGNVIITAKSGLLTTSGVKITGSNVPAEGSFTVRVSEDADAAVASLEDADSAGSADSVWTVAKQGDFSRNEVTTADTFLNYFNYLGAPAEDTRIGLYDAAKIVITGIPESVALNNIYLLSYPGDNIAFTEGASVGILKEDYTYETTEGAETIKAGTVVVTGSYRGSPVYNSVRVVGRFQSMTPGSDDAATVKEQTLEGETLLFAEVYAEKSTSDISDGFFLFIPQDQELFKQVNEDDPDNDSAGSEVLIELKAQMWRAVDDQGTNSRMTSDTVFISAPRYDSMTYIVLESDAA